MYETNLSITYVFRGPDFRKSARTDGHDQETKRHPGRSYLGTQAANSFHVHVQQRRYHSRKRYQLKRDGS